MRQRLKALRAGLTVQERVSIDASIAEQLFALPEWQQARAVLTYLSFGAEIDTRAIIERAWREGKTVALPRVVEVRESAAPTMRWFAVTSFDALQKSALGVEEPPADPACEVQPAHLCARYGQQAVLTLVPGLSFDRRGYRLGYGGGYYDAFLSQFAGRSIGLCRSAFAVDCLECVEPHDVPVGIVLAECGELARNS